MNNTFDPKTCRYSSEYRMDNAPAKVLYEIGNFWVSKDKHGFEVYKIGLTHSTRVAQIGWEGETGLKKAIAEADRRAADEKTKDNATTAFFKDGTASIFLSRQDYDKTIPWAGTTISLAKKAERTDSLGGLTYHFKDHDTAKKFLKSIGI